MQKPELICPAGDLEKLKIAFQYGADAVYASTPKFSMRTREIGFDDNSIKEGIAHAHSLDKKVYLTLNVFPHASEIEELKEHALKTIALKPDAIIIADPGILQFVKENSDIPIHLSTQANTTNQLSADFWFKQGAERIVLARELSLDDIKIISQSANQLVSQSSQLSLRAIDVLSRRGNPSVDSRLRGNDKNKEKNKLINDEHHKKSFTPRPSTLQLEAFVHGAMCMAYSGRCQISNYLTGRDPNKGECIQACRFKYKLYDLEEDLRKGEKFSIYEDQNGTYVLNSKDLCMIDHIPDLINAGVQSFKIEGRLKSIYYVAIITRAYRKAIDLYFEDSKKYDVKKKELFEEVNKTSNRGFTTGFYYNKPDQNTNNYETSRAQGDWGFIGVVKKYNKEAKSLVIEAKNQLKSGSDIEIITVDNIYKCNLGQIMYNGEPVDQVHAGYVFELPFDTELPINSFLRLKLKKDPKV